MVSGRPTEKLWVLMNAQRVGTLFNRDSGALLFQYAPSWLAGAAVRPISLSLPLQKGPHSGAYVYNFFDNLLPDSDRLRARIQAKFQIASAQPFDLLAAIGADCVGAIQLCQEGAVTDVKAIRAQPLSTGDIASLLKGYATSPLGMENAAVDFRISIAGAQEKTALLWHNGQWCLPLGATPTSHIFKLPIGAIAQAGIDLSDSCENEWLCLEIARAFGLPAAKANIQPFNDAKALVVERFDRRWSSAQASPSSVSAPSWLMRLPQEDMCQALGISPSLKYQADGGPGIAEIMQVLLGSQQATDRETFLRSQILFWLLAAVDGHAKNFSLQLQSGGTYQLTPIYDVLSAYPLMRSKGVAKQKVKMAMAVRGQKNYYRWDVIQPRHFVSMAERVGFSGQRMQEILQEMLVRVESVIAEVSRRLPDRFPSRVSDPVFEGMAALAKAKRHML